MTSTLLVLGSHLTGGTPISSGLAVTIASCWAVALITVRLRQPRPEQAFYPRRILHRAPRSARVARDPSLDDVVDRLSWGKVSSRHFDLSTRPLLVRVAMSLLDDRCHVDMWREPERARDLLGDDLFWVVDPDRPLSNDSRGSGPPEALIERLVGRLESL